MKSFEALQKAYEKELQLSEKHKQNAADIKKEIEAQRGKALSKKINSLSLSGQEYDQFLRFLDGKQTLFEAIELLNSRKEEEPLIVNTETPEWEKMEEMSTMEREENREKQEVEI